MSQAGRWRAEEGFRQSEIEDQKSAWSALARATGSVFYSPPCADSTRRV
jgi:hypothetical protein